MVTATHFERQEDEQIVGKMGQAVQDVNSGFRLCVFCLFVCFISSVGWSLQRKT